MFTAGGALIWLAGRTDWRTSFAAGAATARRARAGLASSSPTPAGRTPPRPRSGSRCARCSGVRDIWSIVVFALLFKLDIAALEPIMRPFWVDRGLSLETIGKNLTLGRVLATLAGASLGGLFTLALRHLPGALDAGPGAGILGAGLLVGGHVGRRAAGRSLPRRCSRALPPGMGTAAFLAYLMSVCEKRYAATQFALLSALLALTRSVAAKAAGPAAEAHGIRAVLPADVLPGVSGVRAAAADQARAATQRATASCMSFCRCQATSTGGPSGISATSRGCPKSTTSAAPGRFAGQRRARLGAEAAPPLPGARLGERQHHLRAAAADQPPQPPAPPPV